MSVEDKNKLTETRWDIGQERELDGKHVLRILYEWNQSLLFIIAPGSFLIASSKSCSACDGRASCFF